MSIFDNERNRRLVELERKLGLSFYYIVFCGAYTGISITVALIVQMYIYLGFRVVW